MSGCEVPLCEAEAVDTLAVFSRPPQFVRVCGRHADEMATPVEPAPPRTTPPRDPIPLDDEETR